MWSSDFRTSVNVSGDIFQFNGKDSRMSIISNFFSPHMQML